MARRTLPERQSLTQLLITDLRARMRALEWEPGSRLPSEAELSAEYGVSRTTVRQALGSLESAGLIVSRQGSGSYVTDAGTIHAGMQELRSITDVIRAQGHEPDMAYRSVQWREPRPEETESLGLEPDERVLDIQRAFLADGRTVAYSFDAIPEGILPDDLDPGEVEGSVFAFLESRAGVVPVRAIAEVHAVSEPDVAWGDDPPEQPIYVFLDQIHYDLGGRPTMHSRTYFIEGRFSLVVVRTR